jgi:uncharacterized protein with von Willebrand factor type A (vWA) domain
VITRNTPSSAPHSDLERNIVQFCRVLRDRDLLVTPSEVVDALRTADAIDLVDRLEMKLALRTVLTARREDIPVFDATFEEFWRSRAAATEGGDDHFTSRDPNVEGSGQQQPEPLASHPVDAETSSTAARSSSSSTSGARCASRASC